MSGASRRWVLRSTASSLVLLAGCFSAPRERDSPGGTETRSPSATDTPTSSATLPNWRLSALSAEASVVEQATASHPLTVELSITNNHEFPVALVPTEHGRLLANMPPLEGSEVELVMVPETKEYDVEPESRTNGCWRLDAASPDVALGKIGFVLNRVPETLGPGETYTIRHEVYHNIASETCFPDTTYSSTTVLQFSRDPDIDPLEEPIEGPTFRLGFTLTVDETADANLSIEGLG